MKYFSVITLISHLSSLQHRKIFLVAQSNSSTHPSWSLFMYVHVPPHWQSLSKSRYWNTILMMSLSLGTENISLLSTSSHDQFLSSLPPSIPSLPSMLCVTTKLFSFIPSMVHSASDVCEASMSRWSQRITDCWVGWCFCNGKTDRQIETNPFLALRNAQIEIVLMHIAALTSHLDSSERESSTMRVLLTSFVNWAVNFRTRCPPPPHARVAVSRWFTSSGRSTTTSGGPAPTSWRSTSSWWTTAVWRRDTGTVTCASVRRTSAMLARDSRVRVGLYYCWLRVYYWDDEQ